MHLAGLHNGEARCQRYSNYLNLGQALFRNHNWRREK